MVETGLVVHLQLLFVLLYLNSTPMWCQTRSMYDTCQRMYQPPSTHGQDISDEELGVSANFLATMRVTCRDKPWIPFYQCSKMRSEYSVPECILLYCQNDNQIQSVKGKKSRINSKHWKKIRNYTDWWRSVTRDLEVNQNKMKNNIFTTLSWTTRGWTMSCKLSSTVLHLQL